MAKLGHALYRMLCTFTIPNIHAYFTKLKIMKPPKILLRYFVEAVLIFGSVYGAFLLEDHRAKTEQEQLFAKRWDGLINSIEKDSLKLAVLLTGIDKTGLFDQATGLSNWVFQDSVVLTNYGNMTNNGNIYPIVEAVLSHHFGL